ncbi:MAG: hypothetical protein FJX72_12995 [Armatimonadetes bacterium]|nr:hypothetical protein [Armatimonadota bacterium]
MRRRRMIIALTAAGVLAPLALAQAQGRDRGRRPDAPVPHQRIERIRQARERARETGAKLELNESQRKALAEIVRTSVEKARRIAHDRDLRPAELARKLRELRAERRQAMAKLLTPEQIERLREWKRDAKPRLRPGGDRRRPMWRGADRPF